MGVPIKMSHWGPIQFQCGPPLAEPMVGSIPRVRARARDEGSVKTHCPRLMTYQQPDTIHYFSSHRKQPLETAGSCGQARPVTLACQTLGSIGGSEKGYLFGSPQVWTSASGYGHQQCRGTQSELHELGCEVLQPQGS